MESKSREKQSLTKEAFLAFNKIGGQIQDRSLELLRKHMNERGLRVANLELVQEAYWEACQEIFKAK